MPSLPLVLHVLPVDMARGAQRYARALRDALDGRGARHRILTVFDTPSGAISPDIALRVPPGLRARGFEPRAAIALHSAIGAASPRVIVAHGSEALKYLAAGPPGAPVIYYKIGMATDAAHRGMRRRLHALLLSRATWVAGVSEECLDEARDVFGVPEGKLALIPNGRDPDRFHPRVPRGVEDGVPPVVIFVGRLVATKRPDSFLAVVEEMRQLGLSFTARMVGDGPLRARLLARARAAGVEVLGERDDVAELLRDADVFVFTSVPEGEGMPGVLVEAGLSGLPVVTTDVASARAVVAEGVTGFVVGVDDAVALGERVASLVRDAGLRRRMGGAARARTTAEFSMARSASLWEALLRRALG